MIPTRENGDGQVLPSGWERAHDAKRNRYYYVDHNTKTTTWLNPMDVCTKPKSVSECHGDELPYGWERLTNPVVGIYYSDHIERRNQWSNPVHDWHLRRSKLRIQPHYSNSCTIMASERCATDRGSDTTNNQTTVSPSTTNADKPDMSLQASDTGKSATSLNNSTSLDTEFIDSNVSNNNSTRGSKYDSDLLDIMDNCFGRESSQSVEV